jgi:hypothetical protein
MPAAGAWCLDGDVIVFGTLRVTMQRIAISHWQPDGTLRSWGQAPMQREHDMVLVPCAPDECLWLGAWQEDGAIEDPTAGPSAYEMQASSSPPLAARIAIRDPTGGGRAVAALPEAYQLGALRSEHAPPEPLQLPAPSVSRRLALELECGTTRAALDLVLLPPTAWAARAHRAPPAPLDAPPPLPPRLG